MRGGEGCIYKLYKLFNSPAVTIEVTFNPLTLVFTFKYKVLLITIRGKLNLTALVTTSDLKGDFTNL